MFRGIALATLLFGRLSLNDGSCVRLPPEGPYSYASR